MKARNLPTHYNGIPVKWWIGEAQSPSIEPRNRNMGSDYAKYRIWIAHATCNGKMYQLSATYDAFTDELSNIHLCKKGEYYYDEETNRLLTGRVPLSSKIKSFVKSILKSKQ